RAFLRAVEPYVYRPNVNFAAVKTALQTRERIDRRGKKAVPVRKARHHISGNDFHHLTSAYEFLRRLEHQLQLREGQQLHQLPSGSPELMVLAKCLSRIGTAVVGPDEFVLQVQSRMATVVEIYRRVVYQQQSQQFIDAEGNLRLQPQVPPSAENSYSQAMQRLATDAPRLLDVVSRADLSPHARRNLDRFLSSAATNSERYAAVLRSP